MPDDKGNPTPDELKAARKAEFNEWITEFLGTHSDTTSSTGTPAPTPAPPASSGLTLKDVEDFLNKREQTRKDGDRLSGIEKSLRELGDRVTAGSERRKKFSLFDFG